MEIIKGDQYYQDAYGCFTSREIEHLKGKTVQQQLSDFVYVTWQLDGLDGCYVDGKWKRMENPKVVKSVDTDHVKRVITYQGIIVKIDEYEFGKEYESSLVREKEQWIMDSQYRELAKLRISYPCKKWIETIYCRKLCKEDQ